MLRIASIALLAAACGSGARTSSAQTDLSPSGCVTLFDAGTPCDPCPGAARSTQDDLGWNDLSTAAPLPDGGAGVLIWRHCECPGLEKRKCDDGRGNKIYCGYAGLDWQACPAQPLVAIYGVTPPASTCAEVAAAFQYVCSL